MEKPSVDEFVAEVVKMLECDKSERYIYDYLICWNTLKESMFILNEAKFQHSFSQSPSGLSA